ncbi:MAG: hypothetical protein K2L78_03575 [Muribaculaceae bacterium]|nr:hypothetical protein [Muribaculaceae bacterium]
MKAIKLATILLAAAPAPFMASEATAQVNQLDAEINIIPDKTIKTDNGVRISLCLVGIPHTSQRIDGVDLVIGQKLVKAVDIDGIDFERYFQFEDSGVQTIEVDFPFSGTIPKTAKLVFHTVNGDITSPARQ